MTELKNIINKFTGELSVYAKNVKTGKIFELNSSIIFPSASVIKVFILYHLFEKIAQGEINIDSILDFKESDLVPDSPFFESINIKSGKVKLYDVLHSMITVSDNISTNLLIDFLGFENINNSIKNLGLKNTILQRKMYDFESREKGLDNFTTALDCAIFFENIISNKIINQKQLISFDVKNIIMENYISLATLKIMSEQTDLEKIPLLINKKDFIIANKTGELPNIRNDMALLISSENNFIINIFTKEVLDETYTDTLIGELANYLVNYL